MQIDDIRMRMVAGRFSAKKYFLEGNMLNLKKRLLFASLLTFSVLLNFIPLFFSE